MTRFRSFLLLLAVACGSPTGPGGPTLQLTGSVVFGIPTLATTAVIQPGGVDVTGVIPTPSAEYTLFGKLDASTAGRLIVEVTAYNNRPGAPFPVQNYYVGRIRHLPAGAYELQVFEILHATQVHSELVLRDTIQVP